MRKRCGSCSAVAQQVQALRDGLSEGRLMAQRDLPAGKVTAMPFPQWGELCSLWPVLRAADFDTRVV